MAFADSRIRPETIAAEDVLHDMGVFSMMSSDSQAMGRIGEVITRTWQTAHKEGRERRASGMTGNTATISASGVILPNIRLTRRSLTEFLIMWEVWKSGKRQDHVLWNPAFSEPA